jgi:predicted ATPase
MIPQLQHLFVDDKEKENEKEMAATPAAVESDTGQHQRQHAGAFRRFAYLMSLFLRAISSLSVPVVLLLDDLHYADESFWLILSNMVADLSNCPSLFIVATYDESAGEKRSCFGEAAGGGIHVARVDVGNLDRLEVARFLAHALDLKCSTQAAELASCVFDQTQGHVYYVVEFVKYLLKQGLLRRDDDTSSAGWSFDVQEIMASTMTVTTCACIVDFLRLQLEALSTELRQFLKVASCCGSYVPLHLLQCVFGEMTVPLLHETSALDLLNQDHVTETCTFPHDIIQQVVYNMIPEDERGQFHLEIGRRMWNAIKAADLERSAFCISSQFYFARHLVTELKERYELAQLCLLAGRKAAASSFFRTACVYLNLGIEFLGENCWRDHYHLSLAVYNAAAEMHLCVADFDAMEQLVNVVLKEARPSDRIQSETTRVYGMGMINKQSEAIDLGVQLLAKLGEAFPRRLGVVRVLIEVARVRKQLIGKSDEELLCLHSMEDPEKLACMQILNLLLLHVISVRPQLTPFVILKFIMLTLKHGQCLLSPIAFAAYGVVLCQMGRIDEGYRFGRLAIKMLERLGQDEPLPRVYAIFFGVISPLKRPISEALVKLHDGYRMGLQTGDFEFACLNANLYLSLSVDAGVPLPKVDKEYARMTSIMTTLGQKSNLTFAMPTVQTAHHFMGLTEDPLSSKGDVFDFEEAYQCSLQNKQTEMVIVITLHRLVLLCVFNDFAGAFIQATRCLRCVEDVPSLDHLAGTLLYVSIAYLENAANGFWQKRKAFRIARRAMSLLKKLSLSCPVNYSHMRLFVEAEVAAAKGQEMVAFELYSSMIACCSRNSVLMMEAFGNERCGRFLFKVKRLDEARSFMDEACRVYEQWGAVAKVCRFKEEMYSLFAKKTV